MLPGFTGISGEVLSQHEGSREAILSSQGVTTAGFWDWLTGGDNSQGRACNFSHTETKCILFTMWCKNVWACGINPANFTVITKDSGWYICGACGNPFDW